MSRYITIYYPCGEAKSIKIYFTMRKAEQILKAITWARIIDAEITDKDYETGEPNGCNSPICGKHPPIDNAAAMREALVKADAAFLLISKSAWFIDANFAETKELMEAGNAIAAALSATKGEDK